jgi:hypothetical protein
VIKLTSRTNGGRVVVGPGGYITKPRGHTHAMWNAGSEPGRIIEIIAPGGFENYFRDLGELFAAHANDPAGELLHELPEFAELAQKVRADIRNALLARRCRAPIRAERADALTPSPRESPVTNSFPSKEWPSYSDELKTSRAQFPWAP